MFLSEKARRYVTDARLLGSRNTHLLFVDWHVGDILKQYEIPAVHGIPATPTSKAEAIKEVITT